MTPTASTHPMNPTASTPSSTTATSQFSSWEIFGPPYRHPACLVRMRSSPSRAYGLLLSTEELKRWACWYGKLMDPEFEETMSKLSPEEVKDEFEALLRVAQNMLPTLIYREFPTLPRLRNRLLPVMDGEDISDCYVFVLRDTESWQAANLKLDPDQVRAVGERLGVPPDRKPAWYRVACKAK